MLRKQVRESDPIVPPGNSLLVFSRYKVPSKYKRLKIALLQMGLDPNECDVYILLLENGLRKIDDIASKIGFDRTYTYHIICGLQNKGLVTATFKHPIKFCSVPSEKALKTLSKYKRRTSKEKEELLANNLKKISGAIFTTNKMQQDNFMALDLDEAYSRAKEMQINSKYEILILGHTDDITALSDCGFMNALQSQSQTGINVRILVSPDQNSINRLQSFDGSVRYMEHGALEPFSFIIVDNGQLLVIERNYKDNKPRAVWTTFEPFISALYFLFSDLWESSSVN